VSNPWLREMWRVLVMFAALLVPGLLFGAVAWFLLLGLLIYLGWHLYNLYLLQRWLVEGKRFHPPESHGVWDDVFERIYRLQKRNRKRKRNLGRMLKRFQTATAALPDATIVLGPNRDIEWWNASARDILELRSPRDIGQRIDNLLRHPRFIEYLHKGDFSQSVVIPSPSDYNISLAVSVVPYGENRQLVVARDITRLERLEQARRDFVANVSHELRSPLTVISGYLESLLEEQGEDPVWGKSLRSMSNQTDRMRDIVDDLLLLSRLETGRQHDDPETVDVPGMLAQIMEEAERISGRRGTASNGKWMRIWACAAMNWNCAAPSPTWCSTRYAIPRLAGRSACVGRKRKPVPVSRWRMRVSVSPRIISHGSPNVLSRGCRAIPS
jgi:two-component system, OmpR family, phosphate regulon sensor histidine kinase PhoR